MSHNPYHKETHPNPRMMNKQRTVGGGHPGGWANESFGTPPNPSPNADRHPGSGGNTVSPNHPSKANTYAGNNNQNEVNTGNQTNTDSNKGAGFYSDRHEGSGGVNTNTNNQEIVKNYISGGDNDATFKSYATINYANTGVQNTAKAVNAILNANPKWTKMDALNYLDGKWTKLGYSDNQPRWNNGRLKDLEVSDVIKNIKGGKDWNTWGAGLRSSYEGNWGTVTDKETYTQNMKIRANRNKLLKGSAAWNRNQALSDASRSLRVEGTSLFDNLGGFIINTIAGFPLTKLLFKNTTSKEDKISEREAELLNSTMLSDATKNLYKQYEDVTDYVNDSMDSGSPNPTEMGVQMNLASQLQQATGMDMPTMLKTMSMDGDNPIFNEKMSEGEFKNFTTRLRLIEDDDKIDDDRKTNNYGEQTEYQSPGNTPDSDTEKVTTIDLADPYIGLAWWQDRGGFEKMFGIPLPYPRQDNMIQAKEGGIIGYQTGGSVRPASMINDPNAAPASLRADDVDLQAEEGDFIMGYPAMQQNGPRVRSLVEQAMLKAKDSGVKTKGYKKGDKVDILVHNGEMHIPNELVKYVDGGYAELKNLNQPSKYREGETVWEKTDRLGTEYKIPDYKEGFMEKPELTDKQSETSDYLNNLQNSLENNQLENRYDIGKNNIIMLKNYKTDDIIFGEDKQKNSKNVFYDSGFNFFEKQKWDSLKKRFLSILPEKYNEAEKTAYTTTALNDLWNALSSSNEESNRILFNKLKNEQFLKNIHQSSKLNMLLSNASRLAGDNLSYSTYLSDKNLVYRYTPNSIYNKRPHSGPESIDDNTLLEFLKRNENDGYRVKGIHKDTNNNDTIGYGHKIETDEERKAFEKIINENNGVFPETLALELLKKDIIKKRSQARKVYNNFVKQKSQDKYNNNNLKNRNFDSLSPNSQDMLIELAFNTGGSENQIFGDGQKGLAEFDGLMTAIANMDYPAMKEEYSRKDLKRRNSDFYNTFLSPILDKHE